jgi:HSP20 family molecular chaperone IbpA
MAYILTPRFAPVYQAPQSNPFGFCTTASRPTYAYHTVERPQPRHQPQDPAYSPFAHFFSQVDELLGEIDREGHRQAQAEARAKAQREAQIEAQREAYRQRQAQIEAHIEAQREFYRQRQAQIKAHVEAQREAHRQRQLRKHALRAKFAVTQNEQGWQIDAEVPGFEQENIDIEVTDENTLKIAGNTEWGVQSQGELQHEAEATPIAERPTEESVKEAPEEKLEGIALEPEVETSNTVTGAATESTTEADSARPGTPDSDTTSHKSYQATVEDDFEDLGAEASSLFPTPSQPAISSEPKGKEKAVEDHEIVEDPEVSVPTEAAVSQQPQSGAPAQQHEAEHPQGTFERTYRFPERIDASNVRASFKDGKLTINVPKAQVQQVRRIAIL